jgi:hypothetical protein
MKLFLFALLFFMAPSVFAYYEGDVRFGSFYETNTYYSSQNPKAALAFLVEPHLFYTNEGKSVYSVQTDSTAAFTKFLSATNQDHFTYDLNLKNNFKFREGFQIYITPKAKLLSEPAFTQSSDRLDRQIIGASLGMTYFNDPRKQYILGLDYDQETLSLSEYDHLNNQSLSGRVYYKKYFLPETFVYFGVSGGIRTFPDGTKVAIGKKYDSQRIEPGLGLEGRLTRYFKIRSYLAYPMISYKVDTAYRDPVYLVELEEELSPKDFLIMGLEDMVEDSYFTNYQTNQKIYIGYGKFLGDQMLWVSKMEYLYRTYSRPNRRDDQRFVADTRLEYSYSQRLKLEATFTFDILTSDAIQQQIPLNPPPTDPSASYQNIRVGFYGKYLF